MCSSRARFPLADTAQSILFLFCISWGPESQLPKSPYCACWVHFLFPPHHCAEGNVRVHTSLFITDPWKWRVSVERKRDFNVGHSFQRLRSP